MTGDGKNGWSVLYGDWYGIPEWLRRKCRKRWAVNGGRQMQWCERFRERCLDGGDGIQSVRSRKVSELLGA